jgi:hypothetical protein
MLRLGPNDPRYQRGFGDFTGEMHSTVMRKSSAYRYPHKMCNKLTRDAENVRRFVNILDRATAAELGSPITADDRVTEDFLIVRV